MNIKEFTDNLQGRGLDYTEDEAKKLYYLFLKDRSKAIQEINSKVKSTMECLYLTKGRIA